MGLSYEKVIWGLQLLLTLHLNGKFHLQYEIMRILFLFLGLCMNLGNGLNFCTWADKTPAHSVLINNQMRKPEAPKLPIQNNEIAQGAKNNDKQGLFFSLLNKNAEFRSYHPHYLHSYSYPEPLTPHIYFGQLNSSNSYIFLVKENETLENSSVANQIFYVNGEQSYGSKNILFKSNNLRANSHNLNFAMVAQIENLSGLPWETKLTVYNFGVFYGLICELTPGYMKSFIVYISQGGRRPLNLNQNHTQLFTLQIKNLVAFNNNMNWKYAHQSKRITNERIMRLSENSQTPNIFNTFVLIIKYASLQAAQIYKVAVREFPYRDKLAQDVIKTFHSVQQILAEMKKLNISSFQFKFQVPKEIQPQSCQIKAEKQLLQGLSYQYGDLTLKNGSRPLPNIPQELYSFTPSRKRFPWGFLWDDGFHCQVAVRNEPQLALKVIKSWLDTMHEIGWIPREQNRGAQRQFLCNCPQFMAKDIRDGNPPTLLLALNFLARTNVLNKQNFEEKYWNKLKSWYKWFMRTQTVEEESYIFRWYDSIQSEGSFNSGLDDFPRLNQTIGHVDCQAWMYFFASTMSIVRDKLEMIGGSYLTDADKIKHIMLQKFVSPQTKTLQDFTKDGKFNPHFGYPSLLPLAFGMISHEHEVFASTIAKLKKQLDSGHGITSISMRDDQYLTNGAYWRGPVWINMNFLVLRGLFLYYRTEIDLYKKLRKDLINTVCTEEDKKGYFYENYIQGRGSFSYPFTGWTSLISIIVRENF